MNARVVEGTSSDTNVIIPPGLVSVVVFQVQKAISLLPLDVPFVGRAILPDSFSGSAIYPTLNKMECVQKQGGRFRKTFDPSTHGFGDDAPCSYCHFNVSNTSGCLISEAAAYQRDKFGQCSNL